MDYFIRINKLISFNVSSIEELNDAYIPEEVIREHFYAQLVHLREIGAEKLVFEPILVAVDSDKFNRILQALHKKLGVDLSFVKSIPISMYSDGEEVIRVINSSNIN